MKKELSRRDLMGRAGLALGGAMTLGVLQGCSGNDSTTCPEPTVCPDPVDNAAKIADFPYEKHLPAGFQFDAAAVATIQQAAYEAYYAGGCCHGAYSALLGNLRRAGNPFDQLPLAFGKFGGGGIASYGSICGAALGSILVINMVVENATARGNLMTDLLRWYERTPFPAYVPTALYADENDPAKKPALDFSAANIANLQAVPGAHLCHASVSGWCAANGVTDANGADKKARCARLTADVAAKAAELLNVYLLSGAYGARAYGAGTPSGPTLTRDATSSTCVVCHPVKNTTGSGAPPVNSGMACTSCHPNQQSNHP